MKVQDSMNKDKSDCFVFHKRIWVKDIPYFKNVSIKYFFKNPTSKKGKYTTIIFAKQEEIFEFNFETEEITCFYRFETPLNMQHEFFVTTPD